MRMFHRCPLSGPDGIGSTGDKSLVEKIGEITSRLEQGVGFTNIIAPFGLHVDPRWGRADECSGEVLTWFPGWMHQIVGIQKDHRVVQHQSTFA